MQRRGGRATGFPLGVVAPRELDGDPAAVPARAKEAAQGQDVRLGGGATIIREFIEAGLVDTPHVAVAPTKLGSGARLWESPDELLDRFHQDVVPSPSGVTHHLIWRKQGRTSWPAWAPSPAPTASPLSGDVLRAVRDSRRVLGAGCGTQEVSGGTA